MSFVWPEEGGGGGGPTPPSPPGLVTYLPTGGDLTVNGPAALGRWDGVLWTGPYGSSMASLVSSDPPGATGYHAQALGGFTAGGLTLSSVNVRSTAPGALDFNLYVPVPPGATGVGSVAIGTNVFSLVGGGGVFLQLTYNPLNGGALAVGNRLAAAVDPGGTIVDVAPPGPFDPPTPGHIVELRYTLNLQPPGTDVVTAFTRLVIDWT